jgi:hypothetical protein
MNNKQKSTPDIEKRVQKNDLVFRNKKRITPKKVNKCKGII